ncbi:jg19958 [Pararge aegeria aegeria]|uniref:Jg19958 protein n=1 Tax=Pararge aegeria aegeria TaxID=348720 RepID=A0A8S4RV77_9NEOP|nr:jg19958 [Pararge aegeria aegeria]
MVTDTTGAGSKKRAGGVNYTVTQRGAPCLILDGFGYVASKRRGTRVYWTCRRRRQDGCMARALTVEGRIVVRCSEHNHLPNTLNTDIKLEFVISNRGRRHMRLGGFSFYAEKVFPEKSKVRWRCTRRTCRAYAHTLHDQIFALSNVHSHDPQVMPASTLVTNTPYRAFTHAAIATQAKAVLDD